MQLKSASLHWSVNDASICSMLLLQDLVLVPGALLFSCFEVAAFRGVLEYCWSP